MTSAKGRNPDLIRADIERATIQKRDAANRIAQARKDYAAREQEMFALWEELEMAESALEVG